SLNVISIRTRGSDSAANITRMSTAIESLVEDWLKIKYEILVPCLCSISKRLPEIASSITSMNQPMFSTLGSPSGCDHVQSTVPALSHNVASAYALCVEDVLQRDMEAHAPIVTDALSHLAVAAGEESSFRHFLAFFINAVHRYSSKSNRRHISFIASLPVNSSGQSMQNIVELLKSGQLPIVPAVDAAAEDEVEEIGISSLFRAVTDLPVINSNLPEDLRLLFSGMSLQTASGASLEIAVDNVIAIDQHLKALALAIRHTPLIESHITILKLTDCQIGSSRREGFTFLLDAILSTSTLTELDLSYNPLGEFGVLLLTNKLRAMFPNNLSLWTIGLDRVDCQFQPILELILTISAYSPIRNPLTYVSSLSLRQNSLGPEFFAHLVPVLDQHVSVWSLGLDCNPGCTDSMAHKASYLLRRNFQITTSMRYIYNKSLAMAQQFPSGEAVWSLGSVLSRAPPSLADLEQLTSATMLNHLIIVLRHNLACGDRYYKRRAYSNSFVARDAVSFLREYLKDLASRPCIVSILDRMLKKGWIVSLSRPTQADFMDSPHVCRFGPEELLPHIWKKFSQLIADMKRNIPRLTDSAGDESPCFLASSAVEYLSSNHDDISPAHAESLLEYLSEFSVIYNPAAPSQRFFNSDRDSFMFASQIPIGDILQTLGDLHLFPLQQCTFAIKTQQLWFRCPRWHLPVRVDGLVPDISLDTLPFPRFTMDQVSDQVKISSPNLSSSGSVVTLGTHLGSRVVVKTMLEPDQRSLDNMEERNRSFDQFRREVWMMSSIKSKHIVRLLAFSITPPALMVEFMELGDLSHYVKQHPTPAWPERLRLITRVCKGLNFLHTCCPPIIHLDFKSPNVLLTYDSSRKRVITKISDFGLSRTLELTDSLTGNEDQDNCIWAAPEILSHKPATIKSDVYSLAIVMWEVFRWAQPFSEHRFMHTIYTAILRGDRPVLELTEAELADRQIKRFVELMQAAWAECPVSRPTVEEIVTRLKYLDRAMASDSSSDGATVSEDPVYCKPSRNRAITNFSFDGVVELPTISPSDLVDVKGLDLYSKIRIKRMSMQERSLSRSSSKGI
ncbi:MAG: protein kinase, partial [archaeon]|nr:protein kinase [archaeon]